uniref:Zinc finger PHD-type domain-containing protein n=2 Tax=Lygus hesperus TaxID=30085 RepID=A0A0K8T2J1_LYGHE
MEALWPRKFVSRHLYFAKQVIKQAAGIESLLVKSDVAHYSKSAYKNALMQEFHTLSKLRLDNLRKMDTEDFGTVKCICGNSMDGTAIVCELCHTAMHLRCFKETDWTRTSKISPSVWDENFRLRRLCGYCKRTNRPPIDSVKKMADTVDVLKVKLPECYAVKYTLLRAQKWRRDLQETINLEVLSSRSGEILSFFQKFHAKRYSGDPLTDDLLAECRLIIGTAKGIPRVTLLSLKEELIQGNRFEITPPELNEIWNIVNPLWIHSEIESRLYNGLCYPLRGDSSCSQPNLTSLVKQSITMKKSMKRKMISITPPNRPEGPGGKLGPRKKKKNNVYKKKSSKQTLFPHLVSSENPTEEHEPEANCAAPTCMKPVDAAVDWVMCDGACKLWFHMKCVDLDNKDVNEDFEYICTNCVCNRVCDQVTESLGSNMDE